MYNAFVSYVKEHPYVFKKVQRLHRPYSDILSFDFADRSYHDMPYYKHKEFGGTKSNTQTDDSDKMFNNGDKDKANASDNVNNTAPVKSSSNTFVPTCYFCWEKGHISPNCPKKNKTKKEEKIRKLSPDRCVNEHSPFVTGSVCGSVTEFLLDSGAQVSIVKSYLVPKECYTGEFIYLASYREASVQYPTAKVHLDAGGYKVDHLVAVDSKAPCDVILGYDIGHDNFCQILSHVVPPSKKIQVLTHQQAVQKARKEQEALDRQASEQASAILPQDVAMMNTEVTVPDRTDQSVDSDDEQDAQAISPNVCSQGGVELPVAMEGGLTRADLCQMQNECPSLERCRVWGEAESKFYWLYGLGLKYNFVLVLL